MKALKFLPLWSFTWIAILLLISCAKSTMTGGMSEVKDDCPYQRLRFTGSATIRSEKGIVVLDSLAAALGLEKTSLQAGIVDNSLKIKVAGMTEEVGNYQVPISNEDAYEYVKLSNSICAIRKDLYEGKIFTSPDMQAKAAEQYLSLLDFVSYLKKIASVKVKIEKIDTLKSIIYFRAWKITGSWS